jgi:hypothetical protein
LSALLAAPQNDHGVSAQWHAQERIRHALPRSRLRLPNETSH